MISTGNRWWPMYTEDSVSWWHSSPSCITVFLTEWFWKLLQGLMWQIYLFMQKEVFFFFFFSRSMAYYAFFIEGIEVAWTEKSWCKTRKKQTKQNKKKKNQQNVYQKTQTNEQCLFNFTVSVEFSCKYVSNDIFLEKKISLQHCRMWGVTPSQE